MKSLLVHGCYDSETFRLLESFGVRAFGFDLRPSSPNLVTFGELKKILKGRALERVLLLFANEKLSTVESAIDLLKDSGVHIELEFRDSQSSQYYALTGHPFFWFWRPEGDWRNILELSNLKGVILSTNDRSSLLNGEFWEQLQGKSLEVYIHTETLSEAEALIGDPELSLSVDLTSEVETSYRRVDLEKLRNYKLWSHR